MAKNALSAKFSFCVIAQYWCKDTIFAKLSDLFFKNQLNLFPKQKWKINYNEPLVKLKLLGLTLIVKLCPEPAAFRISSKNVLSFAQKFNGSY